MAVVVAAAAVILVVDAVSQFSQRAKPKRENGIFFSHYAHSFAQLILLTNEMSRNVAIFVGIREKVCIATDAHMKPTFGPYF